MANEYLLHFRKGFSEEASILLPFRFDPYELRMVIVGIR